MCGEITLDTAEKLSCASVERKTSYHGLHNLTSTENERVDDQNSAFVGPQNLVGYLFDGEIVVFIGENPPKIQIHASTERGSFSPGGGLKQ